MKTQEQYIEEFDKEFECGQVMEGLYHYSSESSRDDEVKAFLTKALTEYGDAVRAEERERIEQAHMAGYHSCCKKDSSYSDARNYFEALTPVFETQEKAGHNEQGHYQFGSNCCVGCKVDRPLKEEGAWCEGCKNYQK